MVWRIEYIAAAFILIHLSWPTTNTKVTLSQGSGGLKAGISVEPDFYIKCFRGGWGFQTGI